MDLVNVIRKTQYKKAVRERSKNQAFCLMCKRQVSLISFRQAAELEKDNRLRLVELSENNLIHRIHNSRGEILICQNSLLEAETERQKTLPLRPEFLKNTEPIQPQFPKLGERLV